MSEYRAWRAFSVSYGTNRRSLHAIIPFSPPLLHRLYLRPSTLLALPAHALCSTTLIRRIPNPALAPRIPQLHTYRRRGWHLAEASSWFRAARRNKIWRLGPHLAPAKIGEVAIDYSAVLSRSYSSFTAPGYQPMTLFIADEGLLEKRESVTVILEYSLSNTLLYIL
jgi:hypothetical protein